MFFFRQIDSSISYTQPKLDADRIHIADDFIRTTGYRIPLLIDPVSQNNPFIEVYARRISWVWIRGISATIRSARGAYMEQGAPRYNSTSSIECTNYFLSQTLANPRTIQNTIQK